MDQNKHTSSGFLNGLLLGLLLGAGLTLLLTTKKGKKILRSFTEEGLDSLTNFDDLYRRFERITKEVTDAEEEEEESDYVQPKKVLLAEGHVPVRKVIETPRFTNEVSRETHEFSKQEELEKEIDEVSEALAKKYIAYANDESETHEAHEEPQMKVKTTRRRFFRGIHRRN